MRPTRYPEQPKDNCWVKPSTLRQISARRHRTGYPAERSFPADSAPPHLGAHTRTSRAHAAQPICQARGPTGDTKKSRHPTTASPEHIRTENQNYSHSRWFTASRAKRRDQPKAKKGLPDFRPTGPCTCFSLSRSRYAPISVCSVVRKLDILRQHMNSVMQMKMTPQILENAWLRHLPRLLPLATYITKNAMIGSRIALAA